MAKRLPRLLRPSDLVRGLAPNRSPYFPELLSSAYLALMGVR